MTFGGLDSVISRGIGRALKPTRIGRGVFQLRALGAKVTLIQSIAGDGYALVDAGGRGSGPLIAASLRELGVAPDSIEQVVLTHNHPDHAGGVAAVVELTGADVLVHEADAGPISGATPPASPFQRKTLAALVRPVITHLTSRAVPIGSYVSTGDRIPLVDDFEVIHTPGHTAGSICLFSERRRILISGDTLQLHGGVLKGPAKSVTEDYEAAIQSLRAIADLDFDIIAFSHFPPILEEGRERLRTFLSRIAA